MPEAIARTDTLHPRAMMWIVVAALAGLVVYVAFRGYLTPELLLNFANAFYC